MTVTVRQSLLFVTDFFKVDTSFHNYFRRQVDRQPNSLILFDHFCNAGTEQNKVVDS